MLSPTSAPNGNRMSGIDASLRPWTETMYKDMDNNSRGINLISAGLWTRLFAQNAETTVNRFQLHTKSTDLFCLRQVIQMSDRRCLVRAITWAPLRWQCLLRGAITNVLLCLCLLPFCYAIWRNETNCVLVAWRETQQDTCSGLITFNGRQWMI